MSPFCNHACECDQDVRAVSGFQCRAHPSGSVCHCNQTQSFDADALIQKFRELCPQAYDRNDPTQRAPTSEELNLLASHMQEPPNDDGSSADEGVPGKNSGWIGVGPPLQVGVGYTSRDCSDGQGLAAPGRWLVESRRYPSSLVFHPVR